MNLRRFIDVGFAIIVAEYQRLGTDLLSAIDKVSALGLPDSEAVPEPDDVAEGNARSMEALMGMMGGVKGAPVG